MVRATRLFADWLSCAEVKPACVLPFVIIDSRDSSLCLPAVDDALIWTVYGQCVKYDAQTDARMRRIRRIRG
jgi:hypothetical protein